MLGRMKTSRKINVAFGIYLAASLCGALLAGACTKEQVARVTTIAIDGAECVDKTVTEHPEMTPEQVALTCGLQAVPDVISLIRAKKARLAAVRQAACARP